MKKLLDRIGKTLLTLTALMLIPSLGWSEGSGHEGHGRDARVGVLFIGGGTREHAHTIPTYGVVMLGEVVLSADHIAVLDRGRLRMAGALDDTVPADAAAQPWLESILMGCA